MLRMREKICYSIGDLASNLYWNTFAVYLLFFYTDVFGISAAAAGTLFLIARLFDGVTDPIVGMIADRTETRWGKFRPYLVCDLRPVHGHGRLDVHDPPFGARGKVDLGLCHLRAADGLVHGFQHSLLRDAGGDLRRSDRADGRRVDQVHLRLPRVRDRLRDPPADDPGAQRGQPGPRLAAFLCRLRHRVRDPHPLYLFWHPRKGWAGPETDTSIKDDLHDLMRNRPWVILAILTVTFLMASNVRGTVSAYYFKYYVGSQRLVLPWGGGTHTFGFVELVSVFNATGQGLAILGVMLLHWFARLVGKKPALGILLAVSALSNAAFFLLRPDQVAAMFLLNLVGSLSGAPLFALVWSMYADAADYSEWRNGRRATGLVFSASIMGTKVGGALGAASAGWLLASVGFLPNVAESQAVLRGIVLLMSLIPAAIGVVSFFLVLFYPLNERKLREMAADLRVRRAGIPAAVV